MIAVVPGLLLGLSLIVAIGAQNLFVLRQGLRREHVGAVVVLCSVSDLALISAGVVGSGTVIAGAPWLVTVLRVGGACFLFGCAVLALRRVARPVPVASVAAGGGASRWSVLGTGLAVTWLNPHAYLDTVLVLGGVAVAHGEQRWPFAAGAVLASVVWFTALGFGARVLLPLFSRPAAWRVLDLVTAVLLTGIAASLLVG
ncbi:LysE/ArgO family amino acid transporter [Goekera deserti]|uniref:LysE/ArgO family amino acid transporter n=1 Tax=Goekera deserti TaxID=2497753 RepID=UPI001F1691A9|nr:LysE/ArgO family amino acid transporter [Goekera deserti]